MSMKMTWSPYTNSVLMANAIKEQFFDDVNLEHEEGEEVSTTTLLLTLNWECLVSFLGHTGHLVHICRLLWMSFLTLSPSSILSARPTTPSPLASPQHVSSQTTFNDFRTHNDICINGSSSLFHLHLLMNPLMQTVASTCTVFSTYIMCYVEDRASNTDIWQNTKVNLYWQTKVWLLPIHEPNSEHWVLCTIYINKGRILFFDSLAQHSTLQTLLLVCVPGQ